MSARSIRRAHARSRRRRARVLALGAAVALGAAAPSAQAGNFVVTSLADGPSNACDANCTLRDALDAGFIDPSPDTITFASGLSGTIEMDPGQGPFEVYEELNLQGPGPDVITVDANALSNVFYFNTDPAPGRLAGLTVKGGTNVYGGGLYGFHSNVTVDNVTFRENSAADSGGAIDTNLGNLTVTNSRFIGNNSADDAGAISGSMNRLEIRNSTFSGNRAVDDGGAIRVSGSVQALLIEGSTFNNNTASDGGAILMFGPEVSSTIRNTTISGNTGDTGGGIDNTNARDVTTQLQNSTISGNTATQSGGGVFRPGGDDPGFPGVDNMAISSSIVAGNSAPTGTDLYQSPTALTGAFLVGNSLIGSPTGAPVTATAPNLIGVDPELGALGDNGGPTQTMPPAATSPAIDAGAANGLLSDQRGQPRTVGGGTDIGAVERGVVDGGAVNAKRKQKQKGKKIKVKVQLSADEVVAATVTGTIAIKKKRVALSPVTTEVQPGQPLTVTLKPEKRSGGKMVSRALRSGKKAKATLAVEMTDPFGATFNADSRVKLK